MLAIASLASCDAFHDRLSLQPNLASRVVASLMNPAYLLHRDDNRNRRGMAKGEQEYLSNRSYEWKYINVSSRVRVVKHALLALAFLAANNSKVIEELAESDIVDGVLLSSPLYLAFSEPIAWAYCQFLNSVSSDKFSASAIKLAQYVLLVLSRHLNSPRVCYWGLKALDFLFRKHQVCFDVLNESKSAVQTVLKVIRKQGATAAVAEHGCGVLQRLIFFEHGAYDFLKLGGVDIAATCVHKHTCESSVIISCCHIFHKLLTDTAPSSITSPEVKSTHDNLDINLIARVSLPPSERTILRTHLLEGGVCEALLDVLDVHRRSDIDLDDDDVVIQILKCLLSILDQSGHKINFELLMNNETHRLNSDLSTIQCRERMIQRNVFDIFPAILKKHVCHVNVLIAWCNLVCPFILGNETFARKLVQCSDLSESLTAILLMHNGDPRALEAVCRILNALSLPQDNRVRFGLDGMK